MCSEGSHIWVKYQMTCIHSRTIIIGIGDGAFPFQNNVEAVDLSCKTLQGNLDIRDFFFFEDRRPIYIFAVILKG